MEVHAHLEAHGPYMLGADFSAAANAINGIESSANASADCVEAPPRMFFTCPATHVRA